MEDDISRLRNASFAPNEVFSVETFLEVQRNFIQSGEKRQLVSD